jgi:hypothetical protein
MRTVYVRSSAIWLLLTSRTLEPGLSEDAVRQVSTVVVAAMLGRVMALRPGFRRNAEE